MEQIQFTRVNRDTNGNPRYVCHFLNFINARDEQQLKQDFAASLAQGSSRLTGLKYDLALERARKLGGRKFHNKQYGGGIVFQMYESQIPEMTERIHELAK